MRSQNRHAAIVGRGRGWMGRMRRIDHR
jgi:hypothetical protein